MTFFKKQSWEESILDFIHGLVNEFSYRKTFWL